VDNNQVLAYFRAFGKRRKLAILAMVFLLLSLCVLTLMEPNQPSDFHDFAAVDSFLGVDNGLDVFSNIPFALVGLIGCRSLLRRDSLEGSVEPYEARLWWVVFVSIGFASVLSSWYHLSPNDVRIVFDRLPIITLMSAVFTIFLSQTMGEKWMRIFFPLLVISWFSVLLINFSGEWRPYLIMQFLPLVMIPSLVILFDHGRGGVREFCTAAMLFLIGKVAHEFDHEIYTLSGVISGHSVWHLLAAAGTYQLVRMYRAQLSHGYVETNR